MDVQLLVLFIIVYFASLLQTSTGYGFSIIGTPFLLLMFSPHTAIQINIILSILISMMMIYHIRFEVSLPLLWRLIKGSAIGVLPGILLYLYLDVRWLKLGVGLIILILTLLLIFKWTFEQSAKKDHLVGSLSGLLTTSIGVPGPPLLLYFAGANIEKTTLRSTTLAYYLFVYSASLLMQIALGGTSFLVWQSAMITAPALLFGTLSGQWLFKWVTQETFRKITYVILLFTGSYLFVTAF